MNRNELSPQSTVVLSDRDFAAFEQIMDADADPTMLATQEADEWARDVKEGRLVLRGYRTDGDTAEEGKHHQPRSARPE